MKIRTLPLLIGIALIGYACSSQSAHDRLHQLLDEEWDFRLSEDPLMATSVGNHRYNDRLPAVTAADWERRANVWREMVEQLGRIDRERLDPADRINYDMFERQLRDDIASVDFKAYLLPITVDNGFHIGFARLPNNMPFAAVSDYENYIARLRAFPAYVDQHIELMREGLVTGTTLPRVVLDGYEVTIEAHIVDEPAQSVFHYPFDNLPTSVPATEHDRLRNAGRAAITEAIVPAYQAFLDFMVDEYIPNARTTTGASELPNGQEYYAYLIRHRSGVLRLSHPALHNARPFT